jgi:cation:H+ antiporter
MAVLVAEFSVIAGVVALAGIVLARAADGIAEATRLSRLLVGSLLLAVATSLPELTVDLAAVRHGMPDLAVGDLLGSSLMNLLILAAVDLTQRSGRPMLSREAASHALPATLSIALTAIAGCAVLTAERLPHVALAGVGGWSWTILVTYFLGSRMIFLDQRISIRAAGGGQGFDPKHRLHLQADHFGRSLLGTCVLFLAAAGVLWIAGPRLASVAGDVAERSGLGGTVIGTTLVALTTSLPELVAGVVAVRAGSHDLAIGNTFGSNAFNMVLLAPLDAVHPGSLFAAVSSVHAVTTLAIILATAVAVLGQLYRVERRIPICEPDAVLVMLVVFGSLMLVYQLS